MRSKHRVPDTKEYDSPEGKYKICNNCGKKMYYKDHEEKIKSKGKKVMNFLTHSWRHKSLCSEECRKVKKIENVQLFRAFIKTQSAKELTCRICNQKFTYRKHQSYKFCSLKCENLDFAIETIAIELGISKDKLNEYLIEISEKIKKVI